jgi:hypothetical protein
MELSSINKVSLVCGIRDGPCLTPRKNRLQLIKLQRIPVLMQKVGGGGGGGGGGGVMEKGN